MNLRLNRELWQRIWAQICVHVGRMVEAGLWVELVVDLLVADLSQSGRSVFRLASSVPDTPRSVGQTGADSGLWADEERVGTRVMTSKPLPSR